MAVSVNRSGLYYFRRHLIATNFAVLFPAGTTYTEVSFNESFQLAYLPNYAEFTSLFDRYQICGVKMRFTPRYDNADYADSGTVYALPQLYWVVDRDKSTGTNTFASLSEYPGVRLHTFTRPLVIYVKFPSIMQMIDDPGFVTPSAPVGVRGGQWIDCAKPTVPHYGIKGVWSGVPGTRFTYTVDYTYYLKFKDPR